MTLKQSYLSTFSVFFKGRFYVTLYFAYKGIVGFSAGDIMPEVPAPQAILQNPVLRLTRRPVGVIPGRSICPLPASLFTRTNINPNPSYTATKSHLCIPFRGIALLQPQFQYSCFCKRFIKSQDRST
jgi:hypothetical protein